MPNKNTVPTDFPAIPRVAYRYFGSPADFVGMNDVIEAITVADGIERSDSVDDFALTYSHLVN